MEAIRVERSAGLVTITLDRPAKKNAIDSQTSIELDRALADVAAVPDDRALDPDGAEAISRRSRSLRRAVSALTGRRLQPSEDVREGLAAYLERRDPRFRGC